MPIPESFIEEVTARNDIVDVVSSYVNLTKTSGNNKFGLCPFHSEDTPSFCVNRTRQMYYCFGCGAGGNVFTFLMEYENFTFIEAVGALAERVGMQMPEVQSSPEARRIADRKSRIYEINKDAANYFYMQRKGPQGQVARDYFAKRQLSEETVLKFGLGFSLPYSDDLYRYLKQKGYEDDILRESGLIQYDEKRGGHDKFWNRVMFPILDANKHVIGFGGRVLGDGMPKYMNSPETIVFDKSRNLYGLHLARTSRRPNYIVCEGYMDVISMHQAGFDNAVASLGTALTAGHARLLSRFTKEVLLCYDSDKAGVKAALRAIPILKHAGISCRVIHMEPYKDPDEFIKNLGAEAFAERIEQAQNSFLFEISILETEYDLNDPEGQTNFIHAMAKRLASFTDEIERTNYMKTVANQYDVEYDSLRKLVNQIGLTEGQQIEPIYEETPKKTPKKSEGMEKSQNMLLTCLIESPLLFSTVRQYIAPEDFEGDLYEDVARTLYRQMDMGSTNPAQIISTFSQGEDQNKVAAMFNGISFADMGRDEKEIGRAHV